MKKGVLYLLVLLVGLGVAYAAESVYVEWEKTFDKHNYEWTYSIKQTSDSGFIIAGNTCTLFFPMNCDIWLIKTDSEGSIVWDKIFGGFGIERVWSIQGTRDGGYIMAGETGMENWNDIWLIKTDSEGSVVWDKKFNNSKFDQAYSVKQTMDGGYIVAGVSNYDVWLIKTNSYGMPEWNKTFGGSSYDSARSVQQLPDGGYILNTYTYSFGAGNTDLWLIKTDSNGIEEWNKTYGGIGHDSAWSLQRTSDGGYIVGGQTKAFDGEWAGWIIKTDSDGNVDWDKVYDGSNYGVSRSIKQTMDGGYIVIGDTNPIGAGFSDIYLIKLDSYGNMELNWTYGNLSADRAGEIEPTFDNGYIIGGTKHSIESKNDIWLVKIYLDTDRDGILDPKDICQGTPPSIEVDLNGCSASQFCNQFNPLEDKKDPNRSLCEEADWKGNEDSTATTLGKPANPGHGRGKKKQGPNDCYIEKNVKSDWLDDVCMATDSAD